ncbi:metal ABC transporter substrate-binding protein [Ligilactobacillus salitolerans]|uniref:Metal ABC transporter substrate-binding protein n=2 Tax=Ligilactobacillus salitolerans TaxID=1808352 RepID=A0A401IUQ6_9LACO|nr:metal ABC transporter substrate-binding protein [Ligilactobacillus salitolerans]
MMSNTTLRLKKVGTAAVVMLLAVLVTACGQKENSQSNGKINITATTNIYGEVARAVAGNKGNVKSIINDPDTDPHDYDPAPTDAQEVAKSQVVIANGLGYDAWVGNLVKNGNDDLQYVRVGETVLKQKKGDNPHIWYDPQTMPKLARNLAQRFGKLQPKNKAYFNRNAEKYIKSLAPVQQKMDQVKKTAQKQGKQEVYVSEPVFDYAIQAMNFTVGNKKFENDTEKGTDPAPSTIKAMQDGLKKKKIAFFVDNKQASSKTVSNFVELAQKNNIPILKVTETMPAKQNYRQWMVGQYDQLLKIMQKKE